MQQCNQCGKEIEEELEGKFVAFDLQKKKEENFCSVAHLKNWMTKKIIWMCVSLLFGLIITIGLLSEMGGTAIVLFFLPYMIRQVRHSLADVFNGGTFGEFISFAIVLLGTITVIYPAYKLYQEITQYIHLKNRYSL